MGGLRRAALVLALTILSAGATSSALAKGETEADLAALNERIRLLHAKGSFQEAIPLAQNALSITLELHGRSVRSAMAYIVEDEVRLASDQADLDGGVTLPLPAPGTRRVLIEAPIPLAAAFDKRSPEEVNIFSRQAAFCMGQQFAVELAREGGGRRHAVAMAAVNFLAECHLRMGAPEKAEPLLREAVEDADRAFGRADPRTALALHNLSAVLVQRSSYAAAEPLSARACEIGRASLQAADPMQFSFLAGLVKAQLGARAYGRAEPALLELAALLPGSAQAMPAEAPGLLASLALAHYIRGDTDGAASWLRRALDIEEALTVERLAAGSDARKLTFLRRRAWTTQLMANLAFAAPRTRLAEVALDAALQLKGRVLEVVTDNIAALRTTGGDGEALIDRLRAVYQRRARLDRLKQMGQMTVDLEQFGLDKSQEKVESEIAARVRSLRGKPSPVSSSAVRQAIPANTALIEYARYVQLDLSKPGTVGGWGPARYGAWVLRPGRPPAAFSIGLASDVEGLVQDFRKGLASPTTDLAREAGKLLNESLVQPLADALRGTDRWVISADGALHLIPFAALVDAQGAYLLQGPEIAYVTSGRDLVRMTSRRAPQGGVLVLANPAFDHGPPVAPASPAPRTLNDLLLNRPAAPLKETRTTFPALPGTLVEAESLRQLFRLQAPQLFTGERATVQALRGVHGPQILHVATHGLFSQNSTFTRMTGSGLALTGANRWVSGLDGKGNPTAVENAWRAEAMGLRIGYTGELAQRTDDGMLTAEEIALLDLAGTELVVLSACDTGVGSLSTSEGVFGLRRALVLAGAQTQVVSLWRVDDAGTASMMASYYQRLTEGQGRAAALKAVQQQMLRDGAHGHPHHWAAFLPIGDWTGLSGWPARKQAPP